MPLLLEIRPCLNNFKKMTEGKFSWTKSTKLENFLELKRKIFQKIAKNQELELAEKSFGQLKISHGSECKWKQDVETNEINL